MANTGHIAWQKTGQINRQSTGIMGVTGDSAENMQPLLSAPIIYEENSEIYDISAIPIGFGGESQIYHAIARNKRIQCAARIDTTGVLLNPAARENRRRVIEFQRTHSDYTRYHIMPLFASGVIRLPDAGGIEQSYPIDIFPYCPGGDVDHVGKVFSYEELRDSVIPSLNAALRAMHDSNLIHRDIKPQNLFEYDGEIVVSDFGTSVISEFENDNAPQPTETARGTPGYRAPEVNQRYAVKQTDYFSLGCTLAKLYSGVHPYSLLLDEKNDFAFYVMLNEKGLDMEYRAGDEPLKYLIDALTRSNPTERAGYEGVVLWLENHRAFYNEYIKNYRFQVKTTPEGWSRAFRFEDVEYWNENDLAAAMMSKWDVAKRYLYRGLVVGFFDWNQTLQNRIYQIVDEMPTAQNDDLGMACFLHYLKKGGNICWRGREYRDLPEISAAIWEHFLSSGVEPTLAKDIISMLQSEYLSWKYNAILESGGIDEAQKDAISNDIRGILGVEEAAARYPLFALVFAQATWSTDSQTIHAREEKPDSYFDWLAHPANDFYRKIGALATDDAQLGVLAAMGFREQVLALKDKLGNNEQKNMEHIYLFFESVCERKDAVRNHFFSYGPSAYLNWLAVNIDLYTFHSSEAQKLKERIETLHLSAVAPLSTQMESLRQLNNYFSDNGVFHQLFQGDFLVACMGLKKGKDRHGEITATNADAFFIEKFLNTDVPAGFIKKLKQSIADDSASGGGESTAAALYTGLLESADTN